jgi:hypothetical protein
MWVVGVLALIGVTATISLALNRHPRQTLAPIPWDIPRVAASYTTILGALAGFSVVSSIFIANLTVARESPEYESVIGMFLMSFIIFLSSAMEYSTTPNLAEDDPRFIRLQRLAFCYANEGYYIGIGVSWLALRLLLLAIELPYVAGVFTWLLLFSVFAGAIRMGHFLFRLTLLDRLACLVAPLVAVAAAAIYRLGIAELLPGAMPPHHEPFLIAVIGFGAGAAGFSIHSVIIAFGDEPKGQQLISRFGDRITLVYSQAVAAILALLAATIALA